MPIEIRELVIRTEVREDTQQEEIKIDKQAMIEEVTEACVHQLRSILSKEEER